MNYLVIISDGTPVYLKEGFPPGYRGENMNGKSIGAAGPFGLIVLQEKKSALMRGRYHFFDLLKTIFIRHIFPSPHFLQALVAMNEDILYRIEGHGNLVLKKGHYILIPQTGKSVEAELKKDKKYKIFEAIYTLEETKEFAKLFPYLKQLLFDNNGNWVPEARQAGEKAMDTIREMLHYPYTEKNLENYYYSDHLKRLFFLMIAQATAFPDPRLSTDIDAAYQAKDIILKTPAKDPDVNELAKKLLIPVHRLKESFKKLFSSNPSRFIRLHRMEKAWELVTATDKPVKVIAAELGFKKSQSFATKFKARYGMTPLDARNTTRKGTTEK